MNKKEFQNTLKNIKRDIIALGGNVVLDLLLIGSSLKNIENPSDIDIVVVIKDTTDPYGFIKNISQILARYTKELGILVSSFPVNQERFNKGSSQFIKNVKKYGIKIK